MTIKPLKTRILCPPQDDLLTAIKETLKTMKEKSILAITSKVVSIWQGRCISTDQVSKEELIISEADKYLPRDLVPGKRLMHTIKNNLFVPSAGIDASNNYYIFWPSEPKKTAKKLCDWLKKTYSLKECGVIITDSHSIPLRRGVVGISLAHAGFLPLKDYSEEVDLFGRKLGITQLNIVDSLAAAAVVAMGEGNENTPLAVLSNLPFVSFAPEADTTKPYTSIEIKEEEDLYQPFFANLPWKKGGGSPN